MVISVVMSMVITVVMSMVLATDHSVVNAAVSTTAITPQDDALTYHVHACDGMDSVCTLCMHDDGGLSRRYRRPQPKPLRSATSSCANNGVDGEQGRR